MDTLNMSHRTKLASCDYSRSCLVVFVSCHLVLLARDRVQEVEQRDTLGSDNSVN